MKAEESLYSYFENVAVTHQENTALIVDGQPISYGYLLHRSCIMAHAILREAYNEQFIGISTTRSADMIIGLLAILKAGKAYLPLDPEYPHSRLEQLIHTAHLKFTLCSPGEEQHFSQMGLSSIPATPQAPTVSTEPPFISNVVCVLFTSGSTGVPKGVCLSNAGLINQLNWQKKNGIAGPGVRTLQYSHLSFDAAFLEIFVPLTTSGTLYLINDAIRLNAGNLLSFIIDNHIQRLFLAYAVVQFLAEIAQVHNKYPTEVREIITGGELLRITPAIANFFSQLPQCTFMNVYGPTETSVWVTELKLKGDAHTWPAIPSLGYPVAGMQLFIVDEQLQPVTDGNTGEVLISGPGVALGYLNNPQLTHERFFEWQHPQLGKLDIYRTGDMASRNADGSYQFRGRADTQVKIRGGHRVELSEIEVVIATIQGVSQVKVIVREDVPGDKRIAAYATLNDTTITEKEIKQHVANKLPSYMLPDWVVILDQFPFTVSGKIDARALPAPNTTLQQEAAHTESPKTQCEVYLRQLWEELLQAQNIGINDDFFALGGNSLAAIRLMIRIEKDMGKQLPLVSVYQFPTVEKLAALIDADTAHGEFSPLVPLKTTGTKPPIYLIHGDNLNILIFRGIAQHISAGQPVYGLQPMGIDGNTEPLTSIEAIAAYYNEAIIQHDPVGPYAIAGYSFGGYVAIEMARQLQQLGKKVLLLGMLDSDASFAENHAAGQTNFTRKVARQFPKLFWIMRSFIANPLKVISYQYLVTSQRIRESLNISESLDPRDESFRLLMNKINAVHHKGLSHYKMQLYPGKITLFKAMERPYFVDDFRYLGWRAYSNNVVVYNIPGDHSTMLEEPNCKVLAAKLDEALANAGNNL